MLILDRKLGELIRIGDDITIEVVDISPNGGKPRVKLGIEAPREVPIVRKEKLDHDRRTDNC